MMLEKLQQHFYRAVFENNRDSLNALSRIIETHNRLSPLKRINIYRDSVYASLTDTLQDTFKATSRLVGEAFFTEMATHYIHTHPPKTYDLNDFGKSFPDFIATYKAADTLPYLPDVALLEWVWHRAYLQPDSTPMDFSKIHDLTRSECENIHLFLQENLSLIHSGYPIDQIWKTNIAQEEPDTLIDLEKEGEVWLLVWKKDHEVLLQSLTCTEYHFLSILSEESHLEILVESVEAQGSDFANTLISCARKGWIKDIREMPDNRHN